mgnify:CR=1 FL=1
MIKKYIKAFVICVLLNRVCCWGSALEEVGDEPAYAGFVKRAEAFPLNDLFVGYVARVSDDQSEWFNRLREDAEASLYLESLKETKRGIRMLGFLLTQGDHGALRILSEATISHSRNRMFCPAADDLMNAFVRRIDIYTGQKHGEAHSPFERFAGRVPNTLGLKDIRLEEEVVAAS